MTLLAPHLAAYLRERLPQERQASRHTVDAYAYTFKLLFAFTTKRLGVAPSALTLEQLDAPLLLEFLAHLQSERRNVARTRNARLVALRSFMHFVEYRVPSAIEQVRRVLAIPMQRSDVMLVRHIDRAEEEALLDAPDPTTRLGIRDRAILMMGTAGGLRVSEISGLRLDELTFDERYLELRVRGKGRKQRGLLLWREVADAVRAWLAVRGDALAPEVFLNARGGPISRWGCRYLLAKHVEAATPRCPSLAKRRVSPHVLRHTCAVTLLQATGDLRKVSLWLGHASQQTTEIYLQVDPTEKLEALDAVKLPSLRKGTFSPPDQLLASLMGAAPAPVLPSPRSRRKSATLRSPDAPK
jgi:site-specific recombinase XerD